MLSEMTKIKNVNVTNRIIAWRWPIGIILWLIFTIFQIHGSSIGMYAHFLGVPELDTAILGLNRTVQIDEWGVFTPFIFSQYFDGGNGTFSYFSEIIRAAHTDVALVYGVPCWDIITFFRPFLWGYLFLSPGQGLAFFWMGRLIILFLVSYEMGRILANDKKKLACMYACLIAFSQMVQYWFGENSFVEMLIFGQAGVLLLIQYIRRKSFLQRGFCVLAILYCVDGYILAIYPAWQIAFGYIFAAMAAWILHSHWKTVRFHRKDVLLIGIGVILAALPLVHVAYNSWDTIQAFLMSEYPGSRHVSGGALTWVELMRYVLVYPMSIEYFLPWPAINSATFLSFAPLGIIMAVWQYVKCKKTDFLIWVFLGLSVVYYSFCILPWPIFLSKLTLLSSVPEMRLLQAADFLQILILVRVLALDFNAMKWKGTCCCVIIYTVASYGASDFFLSDSHFMMWIPIILAISAVVALYACRNFKSLPILLILISLFSGMFINPISRGTKSIYETELGQKIQKIAEQNQGKWVVDSEDLSGTLNIYAMNSYPVMFGAPTVNCMNLYPHWDRWQSIGLNQQEKRALNRSGYMNISITDAPTDMTCPNEDIPVANIVDICLNVKDLKTLDVSYVFTNRDLNDIISQNDVFELLDEANGYKIYRVR